MLHLIKICPTVGKELSALVTVSEKNEAEFHFILTQYVQDVYGDYTSIVYHEQFAVPAVGINCKIDLFINADELIDNKV